MLEDFATCLSFPFTMLGDDEDVFDSVTWESPSAPVYTDNLPSTGPGYRQSTDSNEAGPHDPKWEGYLITTVTDPQKELAETKDAYVSYLVSAKVLNLQINSVHRLTVITTDESAHVFYSKSVCQAEIPRFCVFA